ncbi:MAG TPA: Ig-like domain-containing protein, partial [Bryobacteraceae bacterium]|nr:Ig-like domain-containing protein [Bryobacteraceae bacterium]
MRTNSRLPFLSAVLLLLILSSLLSGPLAAQSLNLVFGNGQMVFEQFNAVPFVVQAKDAAGNPLPNVAVSWNITQGSGTIHNATLITDASGMATATFLGTSLVQFQSFETEVVTATSSLG